MMVLQFSGCITMFTLLAKTPRPPMSMHCCPQCKWCDWRSWTDRRALKPSFARAACRMSLTPACLVKTIHEQPRHGRLPGRMPAMTTEASDGRRSSVQPATIVPVTNSWSPGMGPRPYADWDRSALRCSVAYGIRWESSHHDRSEDQSLKQNGVFSPVLIDRWNVEDLERQDARHVACRLRHAPPRDPPWSDPLPGPGGPKQANHVTFTPYHVSLATYPLFTPRSHIPPSGVMQFVKSSAEPILSMALALLLRLLLPLTQIRMESFTITHSISTPIAWPYSKPIQYLAYWPLAKAVDTA